MPDEEAVFKLITKDNWELIAEFLDFNRGAIKGHIGYYVWWRALPGESTWSFSPNVPEIHVTVTDGYIADRLVLAWRKKTNKPTRRTR